MNDLIKREDALNFEMQIEADPDDIPQIMRGMRLYAEYLRELPPIHPKSGRWIDRGEDMMIRWVCSECGRKDMHIYNFCPDCGARMEEGSK